MQHDINMWTEFNPGKVHGMKYSALMKEQNGGIGKYYCQSSTYSEAVEEAKAAARQYERSIGGEGDKIVELYMTETAQNGNDIARDTVKM